MTLIDELKQAIMATEGKFAADDFYHITTTRGAHQSAVAKAFRLLRDDFCIKMVGHRGLDAGRDMLCYEVVKGAKFVVKERKEMKPRKATKKIKADKVAPKEIKSTTTTFTSAIADDIELRFSNGQTMTKYDFAEVAKSFGKPEKAITHVLREMAGRGGLRIAGELKNVHGGTASKKYIRVYGVALVPPADYRSSYRSNYQREVTEKEEFNNQCGKRLESAMAGWR